ncbi:hypothetical protein K1X13_13825 [Nocardioides sp. WL0053]|jgi:hypothetical protein|uniref:Uncharacterized protein n=1 Tax=Nocardioides jiangsuensis TaxID=2866161 RepID=A0ABS7RQQ3_9ACTN|nr:hypothetical protein [Nocardioides jiangsuensis]MBY9075907.1 hypothetical protein [Nocardioides jiangsuensis]
MENTTDVLMRSGVEAFCADCGDRGLFVPVEEGCDFDGCEFCCTRCDAAVFLLEVLENTGAPHRRVA